MRTERWGRGGEGRNKSRTQLGGKFKSLSLCSPVPFLSKPVFCNYLDTYSLNVDYYGLCCISEC